METLNDDDKNQHNTIAWKPDIKHLEKIHFEGKHAVAFIRRWCFHLRKLFKNPCSQAELNKIVPFGFSLQRQKNGVFFAIKIE